MAIIGKKKPARPKPQRGKKAVAEAPAENWYDDAAELPRADISENQVNLRKRNTYRRLFWVGIVCMPLALLCSFLAWGSVLATQNQVGDLVNLGGQNQQVESVVNRVTSPGRHAGTQALQEWLDSIPSPLPGGSIQSWNGSTDIPMDVLPPDMQVKPILTREQFTVVDGTGRGYTAEVQVATDPRGGSTVVAGPSLVPLPMPVPGAFNNLPLWNGVTADQQVNPNVQAAVDAWAQAYTSGDADRLRLAVGDTDGSRSYVPIAGVSRVEAEVLKTGSITRGEGNSAVTFTVARVNLSMNWLGRRDGQSPAPVVMDVLVQKADTAAPQVVAWGAPGTGQDLRPYQNSIPTESRDSAPTVDPTATTAPRQVDDGGTAPTSAPTEGGG